MRLWERQFPYNDSLTKGKAMFDKQQNVRALVAVTHRNGTVETLTFKLSLSGKLHETLNNADRFLDVIDAQGKQSFLAKDDIARIELIEVPRANQINLYRRVSDNSRFDPYQVLGVEKEADAAAIKAAYHTQVKRYHPDRFLNIDMPKEMSDYAAAMLVRINLAFEQIGG